MVMKDHLQLEKDQRSLHVTSAEFLFLLKLNLSISTHPGLALLERNLDL